MAHRRDRSFPEPQAGRFVESLYTSPRRRCPKSLNTLDADAMARDLLPYTVRSSKNKTGMDTYVPPPYRLDALGHHFACRARRLCKSHHAHFAMDRLVW